MNENGNFEVGDEVKFTKFGYLYDGLNPRETHKISQVREDGYVCFAEDKRSPSWEINPEHIELVAQVKKEPLIL